MRPSRVNLLPAKERIKHPRVYSKVHMNSTVAIECAAFFLFHHLYLGYGIVLSPINLSEHNVNALLNLCALLNFLVV